MNRFNITLIASALIWAFQVPPTFAQDVPFATYRLESGSRLWLEGTATIGDFTCWAGLIEGMAKLQVSSVQKYDSSSPETLNNEVRVSIFVTSFDCGNTSMNADMYNAMKADSCPLIQYELVEATNISHSDTADSRRRVNTSGKLTIAGVTKVVQMSITIRQLSLIRFQIFGSKVLSMHDFGITPPTALWGLIKADEQLTVHFDLVATQKLSEPGKVKQCYHH